VTVYVSDRDYSLVGAFTDTHGIRSDNASEC
jgi:hypothetical protein